MFVGVFVDVKSDTSVGEGVIVSFSRRSQLFEATATNVTLNLLH